MPTQARKVSADSGTQGPYPHECRLRHARSVPTQARKFCIRMRADSGRCEQRLGLTRRRQQPAVRPTESTSWILRATKADVTGHVQIVMFVPTPARQGRADSGRRIVTYCWILVTLTEAGAKFGTDKSMISSQGYAHPTCTNCPERLATNR